MNRLRTKRLNTLIIPVLVSVLTGCCSPGVKPGDANVFQAGCGVATGQYERGLDTKLEQVDESRRVNKTEKNQTLQRETMLISRKNTHKQSQNELAEIEDKNTRLAESIQTMQVQTKKDQALKEQYLQKLQQINLEIETLKNEVSDTNNEDYLTKIQALKNEVETLRIIVLGQ